MLDGSESEEKFSSVVKATPRPPKLKPSALLTKFYPRSQHQVSQVAAFGLRSTLKQGEYSNVICPLPGHESTEITSWGDLPVDLLECVFSAIKRCSEEFENRAVLVSALGVCRSWRYHGLRLLSDAPWVGQLKDYAHPQSLTLPPPESFSHTVECYIQRQKLPGRRGSLFKLFLGSSCAQGGRFLLGARPCFTGKGLIASKYVISYDPQVSDNYSGRVASVTSNFVGTTFQMCCRDNVGSFQSVLPKTPKRGACTEGSIHYKCNMMGLHGPRKLSVTLHVPEASFESPPPSPSQSETSSLASTYDTPPSSPASAPLSSPASSPASATSGLSTPSSSPPPSPPRPACLSTEFPEEGVELTPHIPAQRFKTMKLRNRRPRWHDQMQCWCLNFYGRVTLASVKNFQLVEENDDENQKPLLQFGKVGSDVFTMDFRRPLSAVQAFAICLSTFDFKLACE
ncbi:hypothetical protein CYMTET_31354 [Cymbomonas tetramitiformis]|uniref:Tubby C-terminal domain-containing protein n=1 Tax=Cymbomonas tetramitiformis TaxID=36881 RepID=A0AAE0FHF4_9CHLO|nr:hypothetical protein CYMTET_31354 [Cymbomonas tetramitiformis]